MFTNNLLKYWSSWTWTEFQSFGATQACAIPPSFLVIQKGSHNTYKFVLQILINTFNLAVKKYKYKSISQWKNTSTSPKNWCPLRPRYVGTCTVQNKIFRATIHKSGLHKFSWEETRLAVVDKSHFSFLICLKMKKNSAYKNPLWMSWRNGSALKFYVVTPGKFPDCYQPVRQL